MEKKVTTLAKYLLTKGIDSSLKIQKMLFFFRVEELTNHQTDNSFFNKDKNFQAWIYGPVNTESFYFTRRFFDCEEEKEAMMLTTEEVNEIDKQYGKWFDKYAGMSPSYLVEKSHKNESWINARGNRQPDEVCKEYMNEDESFTKFIA